MHHWLGGVNASVQGNIITSQDSIYVECNHENKSP